MNVQTFLGELTADRQYRGQIEHVETLPAREAQYAEPAAAVPEALAGLLRRRNIHRLYRHQADAYDAVADGRDVVVVTATASGKTLCYNLPVLKALLEDPDARAMYLFPTKALTQDQFGTLKGYAADEAMDGRLAPAVYDGDTPTHNRAKIRGQANVILTNPDMLHVGILPHHAKWHEVLGHLKYLVLDELHTYRGIFGSHVAGVLRRLLRLCAHYGSQPQILCSSATIANPVELASALTGRDMQLIANDGAPRGRKHFVLWNPPFIDDDRVNRRSGNIEAVELLCQLIERRAQSIVFGKSRVVVELIYKYAADLLRDRRHGELADRIRPYRGGYLPNERREIEKQLFEGKLLAVTATNALELGIDVGALDAAVLVGFPNTICSMWQQAGRAGRTSQDSLVVLVGYNEPVDQYLMRHPDFLFGASHEHGVIDPTNPYILKRQLSCACFEKPLTADDEAYFSDLMPRIAELLAEEGAVRTIDERSYWAKSTTPAVETNLRTISDKTYTIVDVTEGGHKAVGNVDGISALELVYPNAIYLHEGQSYLVRELDLDGEVALVERKDVDYYTQPIMTNACTLREPTMQAPWRTGGKHFGPAEVSWQTTGFQKVKYYSMEMIGQTELDLPVQRLETTACWIAPHEQTLGRLAGGGYNPIEALCGLRTLLVAALPQLAMCDQRDISGQVDSRNLGSPVIVVYDRYPGGVGFAMRGYELLDDWLGLAAQIVRDCPCTEGCPACVGLPFVPPGIHHDVDLYKGHPVPSKAGTIRLIEFLEDDAGSDDTPF